MARSSSSKLSKDLPLGTSLFYDVRASSFVPRYKSSGPTGKGVRSWGVRRGAERRLKKVAFYPLALELELRRSEQQL